MPGRELIPTESFVVAVDGDAAYNTGAEIAAIVQANTGNLAFTKIWEMTVPAQQQIRWGSGSPNQQRNQGFMYFFAIDVSTDFEEGIVRLVIANARETRSRMIREIPTQRLHTTTATTAITATPTDISTMVPLPAQRGRAGEDSLLQIWFKTTIAGTTIDDVGFAIPVTIYQ